MTFTLILYSDLLTIMARRLMSRERKLNAVFSIKKLVGLKVCIFTSGGSRALNSGLNLDVLQEKKKKDRSVF